MYKSLIYNKHSLILFISWFLKVLMKTHKSPKAGARGERLGVLIRPVHSEAFVCHVTSACWLPASKRQVGSESVSPLQSLSRVWLFATPWTAACQASLSISNSQSLTQTHVHWVSDAIQPSPPLLLPPAIVPRIRVFSMSQFFASGSQSSGFNISPSNEYSGQISFRMDWLDLLVLQGTL